MVVGSYSSSGVGPEPHANDLTHSDGEGTPVPGAPPPGRCLHHPWDVGTARLLAALGFEALATTSAGYAFSVGQRDNTVGREKMMEHVEAIASATDLPVSGDLENGFGDDPEAAAETIRLGAAAGLVGGSIEDSTGRPEAPLYEPRLAAERVRAAVDAARALPFPFTLTGRAENFLVGRRDLADTIARLQAYQEAGVWLPGVACRRFSGKLRGRWTTPRSALPVSIPRSRGC